MRNNTGRRSRDIRSTLLPALAAAALAGCSMFRWSGHHGADQAGPDQVNPRLNSGLSPNYSRGDGSKASDYAIRSSSSPRAPADEPAAKPTPDEMKSLYYSDLGPSTIDVSEYPTQQKYNYKVYASVCSRCHTLARSINAPVVSRAFWEFYLLGMRARNHLKKFQPITKDERKAILDFLDYDSHVRKVAHRKEFERREESLKRRFAPILEDHLRRLQENNPRILPSN